MGVLVVGKEELVDSKSRTVTVFWGCNFVLRMPSNWTVV